MSNTFGAPGLYITEQLSSPVPSSPVTSPSVAGFIGQHWRGPIGVAIKCNRWADFIAYYGGFNPNATPALADPWLPYAVFEFFNNGGTQCWINRVGSSSTQGTAATTTLIDQAATPQNTLSLTAGFLGGNRSIGTWGNNLYANISLPAGASAGTFTLTIYYGGTAASNIVENWTNLTMNSASPRYAPTILNSTTSGSLWVFATDLHSATSAPLNTPKATTSPQQLSTGTDTTDPSAADYEYAVTYGSPATGGQPNASAFDSVPGMLNIALPGISSTAILAVAISYASATTGRPYTFLVMDPAQGQSTASVLSYMQTLQGLNNSTFADLYYPWVVAVNPASASLQSTVTMPPSGVILGQYAANDTARGPWYAPAGTATAMIGIVGLERTLGPNDFSALNLANVNALRTRSNGQTIIWGARTMQTSGANVYVPIRRTLNYIESAIGSLLSFAVFQPNDSLLWSTIVSVCDQFLSGLAAGNAFQGNTQATQYYVICDNTNNTPQSIAQGIVNTTIGVALNAPAEFINLTIQQFTASGATTITATV